jgi:ZIP family zinc transporter
MTGSLISVLSYALIPAAAIIVGGVFALIRPPGAKTRSAVQHLAAGIVFAAVAVELLPEILHDHSPLATVLGMVLGVSTMFGIKRLTESKEKNGIHEGNGKSDSPNSLLAALGVDVLVDGMLIGVGFAAGAKQGLLLTVALAGEVLFLGVSAAVALTKTGVSRVRVLGTVAGLATALLLGAGIGGGLLAGLKGFTLDVILTFGAAALLYLVTEELLLEAHEEPDSPALSAMFFVGFTALLVVEMLVTGKAG